MNIFNKLETALRGSVSEVGQAIVDTQAIRILEQEMRDAKSALDDAKTNLTAIMAEKMAVDRNVKHLKDKIKDHEGYALQALDKGDETLASDLTNKIANIEYDLKIQQGIVDEYVIKITHLKKLIHNSEHNIQAMDREVSVVKTTESVQQANDLVSAKFSGSDSSLRNATELLERIKKHQQKRQDQAAAAIELEIDPISNELHDRLEKAGIVKSYHSGRSVLTRLQKQSAIS